MQEYNPIKMIATEVWLDVRSEPTYPYSVLRKHVYEVKLNKVTGTTLKL